MLSNFSEQGKKIVISDEEHNMVLNIYIRSLDDNAPENAFLEEISKEDKIKAMKSLSGKGIISCNEDMSETRLLVSYDFLRMNLNFNFVAKRLSRSILSESKHKRKIPYYAIPTDDFIKISKEEFFSIRKSVSIEIDFASEILSKLSYHDFLRTPYWKNVAYIVKIIAGERCRLCNSGVNLQAHHRFYPKRGYEIIDVNDCLTCLCEPCHSKFHGKND